MKGDYAVSGITNCARCGGMHLDIVFKKFTKPCGKNTHYAPCPKTHEPILMQLTPDKKPKAVKSQLARLLELARAEHRTFLKLPAKQRRRVARRDLKRFGIIKDEA